jgi:hypothetical protein
MDPQPWWRCMTVLTSVEPCMVPCCDPRRVAEALQGRGRGVPVGGCRIMSQP